MFSVEKYQKRNDKGMLISQINIFNDTAKRFRKNLVLMKRTWSFGIWGLFISAGKKWLTDKDLILGQEE